MAKIESVDEYIASQPDAVQGILSRVRGAIRKAVPGAAEEISYQIPTYKLDGRPVLYFAGWSRHYSLYPAGDGLVAAFMDQLAPYKVNKGTIRFPFSQPVPVTLIERIAKFRAKEVVVLVKSRMEKTSDRGRGTRGKGAKSLRVQATKPRGEEDLATAAPPEGRGIIRTTHVTSCFAQPPQRESCRHASLRLRRGERYPPSFCRCDHVR
jgi:uncharacterized protein YdhG (YjbR/CyaY superfamily)